MSSTERAPEPTMEEILASIRRIITDDEAGQAKAAKPAPQAQSEDESLEGEADNQIIDDIARVLSGGSEAPADEEEEILDLAAELGGLEIVEDDEPVFEVDEPAEAVEMETIEMEAVEILDLEEIVEAAPEPVEDPSEVAPVPEEARVQEPQPVAEMAPSGMAAPEPPVPEQPEPEPAPKLSASEEAASALERAIAALRAGQVPTSTTPQAEPFQFHAAPQPEAMTEPEPLPMAEPMPEPEPAAETHPEPEAYFEPEFEAEPESAPVLEPMDEPEEPEIVVVAAEETVEFVVEPEPETPPFWPVQASEEPSELEPESVFEAEPEPEPAVAQVNGSAHHDIAGKSLEDSIKDMLRPMLRQWLDENMPRIVREMDPEALRRNLD